jgi:hypothetical protein
MMSLAGLKPELLAKRLGRDLPRDLQPKLSGTFMTQRILEQSNPQISHSFGYKHQSKIATLKSSTPPMSHRPDSEIYGGEVRILLFGKQDSKYLIMFSISMTQFAVLSISNLAEKHQRNG